jgi:hypothetical protein
MDVLRHHVGSYVKEDGIHASALKRNAWREDDEINEEADDEQEDEEEKADEEDEQPMTAAALAVDLTEGTVADPNVHPVMNAFNIPGDNMQALAQLHKEVTRRMQQLQIESGQEPVCKGSVLYEDGKHMKLFVEIPKGESKSTFIKLRNIVVRIIASVVPTMMLRVYKDVRLRLSQDSNRPFFPRCCKGQRLLHKSGRSDERGTLDCHG